MIFRRIWRKYAPNPLDKILRRAVKRRQRHFLITWNRGLGDIALGLYALVYRIRQFVPEASITFLTRTDLYEGFSLLKDVQVFACPSWKRGTSFDLDAAIDELGLKRSDFDVVLENPDVTWWLKWQLGTLVPKLQWQSKWDALHEKFSLNGKYIGVHVQTETQYGYQKNWSEHLWRQLFEKISVEYRLPILLFGFQPKPIFEIEGVVDLRGKTTVFEMISIIKNCCSTLVAPDSGVLSLIFYIDAPFPLKIISLWADPSQGILKQNVLSPNKELVHIPLIGEEGNVDAIGVDQVCSRL